MKKQDEEEKVAKLSQEQIQQCISILNTLNTDTNQIFEIPKDQRLELLMAAGLLSRPSKEELLKRKRGAKKVNKRKVVEKDIQARNATGIRSAREATIFIAPKMIALTGEANEKRY